jgi:hypothetical protein
MARWREKAAAEQAAEQPQQTAQPGEEPILLQRKVEHVLCATQFNRNAICDCKNRKDKVK